MAGARLVVVVIPVVVLVVAVGVVELVVVVVVGELIVVVVLEVSVITRTKTSEASFVSPGTRLVAPLWKATIRPSAERMGAKLFPTFPWPPVESTLTRLAVPVWRSWTNTSWRLFVSPFTRLVAPLW
jgi:hypothetical protein